MMDGSMPALIWVWPVFVLVGLGLLIYVLVRVVAGGRSSSDGGERARRILDERYARGEIDDEEYRRRRAELR
jgi:putative membrane protein